MSSRPTAMRAGLESGARQFRNSRLGLLRRNDGSGFRCARPGYRSRGLGPGALAAGDCQRSRNGVFGGSDTREDLEPDDERWDNPTMIVTLDAKRRLTIPAALAPASPGDYFEARFDADENPLVFRRLAGKESWLSVLKACPVSPEDVPPRHRAPARRRK